MLAFRTAAQSLDRRRPVTQLLDVAGASGIQDTPPGNADVSLAALWGRPEHSLVEVERTMVAVIGSKARSKGDVSAAVTASVPGGVGPVASFVQGGPPERERL